MLCFRGIVVLKWEGGLLLRGEGCSIVIKSYTKNKEVELTLCDVSETIAERDRDNGCTREFVVGIVSSVVSCF